MFFLSKPKQQGHRMLFINHLYIYGTFISNYRSIFCCPYLPQISNYLRKINLHRHCHQNMQVKPYYAIEISMRHLYIDNMTPGFDILVFRWSTDTKFSLQGKNAKKIKNILFLFIKNYSIFSNVTTFPWLALIYLSIKQRRDLLCFYKYFKYKQV